MYISSVGFCKRGKKLAKSFSSATIVFTAHNRGENKWIGVSSPLGLTRSINANSIRDVLCKSQSYVVKRMIKYGGDFIITT